MTTSTAPPTPHPVLEKLQGHGVVAKQFVSYPWTPYISALILFHPGLLLQYAWRWVQANPVMWLKVAAVGMVIYVVSLLCLPWILLAGVTLYYTGYVSVLGTPKGPLVLQPATTGNGNKQFLTKFMRDNKAAVQSAIAVYGTVLFRGFDLDAVEDFEQVLDETNMKPTDFFGQAPRKQEPGWKYIFRNIAFESSAPTPGIIDTIKKTLGVVWSWAPMFLNFHNEMAYLDEQHHLAQYGVFACRQEPEAGGYTLFADARKVHARLQKAIKMPSAMKWVLARKKKLPVEKKETGSYIDFLLGKFELAGVKDQWMPNQDVSDIYKLCNRLNLDVVEGDDDIQIWSKWVSPSRAVVSDSKTSPVEGREGDVTWWCNCNHVQVGSGISGAYNQEQLPWYFKYPDGEERHATVDEVFQISSAYWMETSFFDWHRGDLLIFDNQLIAHDATPGRGKRLIMPSFGSMF
eukprot:GFYU01016251.1.p1 GENE.GFYU01016251.1~~GFYU01016251.1.p1  ORF type:complete len:460 (-),score=124.37 GFYU01016251.1:174-1553(-)